MTKSNTKKRQPFASSDCNHRRPLTNFVKKRLAQQSSFIMYHASRQRLFNTPNRLCGIDLPFLPLSTLSLVIPMSVLPITTMAATDTSEGSEIGVSNQFQYQSQSQSQIFQQLFDQNEPEQMLLDDAQVDETLTALRLKQAVEAGIIDAKVLEEYRKNTLKPLQTVQTADSNAELNSQKITADDIKTNQQGQIVSVSNQSNPFNQDTVNAQTDILPAEGLAQSMSWQELQQAAKQAQSQQYQMQSVQELEQHAQQITTYIKNLEMSDSTVDQAVAQIDQQTTLAQSFEQSDNSSVTSAQQIHAIVEQNQQQVQSALSATSNLPAQQNINEQTLAPSVSVNKKPEKSVNVFKRLYANLFSDGYLPLPRLDANIYLKIPATDGDADNDKLVKVDTDSQPAKNIQAALEDLFVESVADFTAALPKIRETAKNAAEAVGYYDVQMSFKQTKSDSVDVIIDSVGEPVIVDKRVVEVRNIDGTGKEALIAMQESLPPLHGEVFNHGIYEASKQAIAQMGTRFGYFDANWLNQSVDIILPDNTADIALLYDAGRQYDFGNVVFFTYDKDSQQLTTDPDKLPLKPQLLKQLLTFQKGDSYYAPAVTKFGNDLSATRYFNAVNVETVLPQRGVQSETVSTNHSDHTNNASFNDEQNTEQVTLDDHLLTDDLENVAAIEFKIDDDIENKLTAIEQKAQRLYQQPDNRVLVEQDRKSTNLLGKISDGISHIANQLDPLANHASEQDIQRPELNDKITPEQVYDSKQVPIYVYVQSDKPRDAEVGLGYGTDSGVRVTGRLDYNLINRSGYQAGIQTSLSEINKNVSVYASRPWKHPLNDTIKANLKYEEELIDQGLGTFGLQSQSVLAGLAHHQIQESGWNRTHSIRYRYDELSSKVDESLYGNLPIRFAAGDNTQQALLFGYGMSKTKADNLTNPNFGFRQYYSLEGGSESLNTDTNMVIVRAGISGIHSFGESLKHQVLGSVDGGYIWATDFSKVPYKLRFFAGGDQSIRGYDYNSLAPLQLGYLYGGQALAVGSFEYNYEFLSGLRGAVFTDVGNAYDADFKTKTKVGAGLGIRWASPVGPVRVDLAAGVSEEDPPIRLHFFIGSPLR